jgi:hypothetical protein
MSFCFEFSNEAKSLVDRAHLSFPRVSLRGVQGFYQLYNSISTAWIPSIYDPQQIMGMVMSGISPIRTIAKLGEGIVDLIVLPMSSRQANKGWIRGIKSGLQCFRENTAKPSAKIISRAGHFVIKNALRPTIVAVLIRDEKNGNAIRTVPLMIIDETDRLCKAALQSL